MITCQNRLTDSEAALTCTLSKIKKNIIFFLLKIILFTAVKNSNYILYNRRVIDVKCKWLDNEMTTIVSKMTIHYDSMPM